MCYRCLFTIVAGCDFDRGSYNLLIEAGARSITFDVGIIDDDIYEKEDESFNLVINELTVNNARRCNPFRTTVTVKDNEQRKIYINFC